MSATPQGAQLLGAYYGVYASGSPKTIPATAGTQDIFTVSGGRILLSSLTGVVTTVIGGTATTLSVGVHPTGGANANTALCTATAITSAPVGAIVALPQLQASALIVGTATGVMQGGSGANTAVGIPIRSGGICLVSAGTITITTSANNTGAFDWSLTFIPYDVGATVTPL